MFPYFNASPLLGERYLGALEGLYIQVWKEGVVSDLSFLYGVLIIEVGLSRSAIISDETNAVLLEEKVNRLFKRLNIKDVA